VPAVQLALMQVTLPALRATWPSPGTSP